MAGVCWVQHLKRSRVVQVWSYSAVTVSDISYIDTEFLLSSDLSTQFIIHACVNCLVYKST